MFITKDSDGNFYKNKKKLCYVLMYIEASIRYMYISFWSLFYTITMRKFGFQFSEISLGRQNWCNKFIKIENFMRLFYIYVYTKATCFQRDVLINSVAHILAALIGIEVF